MRSCRRGDDRSPRRFPRHSPRKSRSSMWAELAVGTSVSTEYLGIPRRSCSGSQELEVFSV